MNARTAGAGCQVTGAALLIAWVLAACGLEADVGAKPFDARAQSELLPPSNSHIAEAAPDRHGGATIETGRITLIERVVVTPASRGLDEVVVYRVVVRLDGGQSHEFTEPSLGGLRVGDRVQVVRSGSDPTT